MKLFRHALTLALAIVGLPVAHAQVPTWPKTTPADVTAAGLSVQINGADFGNNTFVLSATLGGTIAMPAITPAVFTSPDGTTWTRRTLPVTGANLGNPHFLNGKFFLGMDAATDINGNPTGASGAVLSSADGITWSAATLSTKFFGPDNFTYGNGIYVASASPIGNQATQIITSTDGLTWTPRTVAAGTSTSGIAFFKSKFYVTVTGGTGAGLYVSSDGTAWAMVATAPANPGELTASPSALLMNIYNIGNSSQALSTDGVTFTSASPGIPFASGSIRYVNSAFVTPASLGLIGGQIVSNQVSASFDGRTWSTLAMRASSTIETQDVREIVYGNGNYVFVGEFDVFAGTTTISPGGTSTGGGTTAPTISAQPAATQTIALGGSVSFTITATGTGLTYQWYFNTVAISGAVNATYTINSTATTNAGNYTVVVSNSGGSITSNAAALAITIAASNSIASETVTTGHGLTFSAGNTAGSLQWQISTDNGTTWVNLANDSTYSGVLTATLSITNAATALNNARYRYVAALNGVIATSNAAILTVAQAFFPFPTSIAVDSSGNLYVGDANADTIQKISFTGQVTLVAGTSGTAGSADGIGAAARFNQPGGLTLLANGTLLVADTANATIRSITSNGTVTTIAGSASKRGNLDATGSAAMFSSPTSLGSDASGVLFVADAMNDTIRKISSGGVVTTFAGTAGVTGNLDATGATARFNLPSSLAVDAGGIVYVADTTNNTVRKITPGGVVTTLAGLPGVSGTQDGVGGGAFFNHPQGLAVDGAGNIYLADTGNSTIRKITPAGVVTTLAGLAGIAGLTDGTGNNAFFNQPQALSVDATGNLYVADTGNATIRKVTSSGVVTTLALSAPSTTTTPTTTTPTPTPTTTATPTANGGGGSIEGWFVAILGLIGLLRRKR